MPSTHSPAPRRVLLTRSEEDCAEWAPRFRERGAEPVSLPCIRCEVIDTPALRDKLAAASLSTDWLAFTSRRGVEAFAALQPARHARWRVAVVGAATAAAAQAELEQVDLVGRGGTAASLAATLVDEGDLEHHPRVLLAVAENAGDAFERTLAAAGAHCVRCDVYRTVPAPPARKRPLSSLRVDNVVLASPSAVTGFVHQVELDVPVSVYTIGPSTTAAARNAGLVVTAEAHEPSLEGILEAMQWRN
jgi:uroporphyrinogen III methyltransferase/synthase